ncbi:MAG: hypothetical protein IID46_14360, partial [Planctomycetes bacterium]|nr:hypothetical protein [Planctomycetota bacterium]
MSGQIQYELHAVQLGFDETSDVDLMPWHDEEPPHADPPFPISEGDGTVWARLNGESGLLERSSGPRGAEFALRVVKRRFSADLALLTRRSDVLVNGLPALKLTLLGTKDSVRLAPGCLVYVTERVTPYVGPATAEMVGKKCPFCRVPIADDAHVVTCPFGAVYH